MAKDVFYIKLCEKRIFKKLMNWILDFCSNLKASILVNNKSSHKISLKI